MTALAGDGAKAASRAREKNAARQKRTRELQRQWVLDGELTAAQLLANRDRLRAECMQRHPEWFGATS